MRLLLAVSAVAALLAILAPEFIPGFLADTGRMLEDLYLQLLLLPGAANASVTPTKTAGADLKQEQQEETRKNADTLLAEADVLRQKKATNEREIDAQQRISAQRYAEARRAEPDMADIVPLPVEHPDEIRQRMVVDRFGPEMRCGETLPPESRITTRSVELHAESIFQGSYGGQFAWKYVVTFSNNGEETVQMLTRHWVFVDALGRLETEVKGPGARGVTPVLPPGGQWVYESGTRLKTPHGTMHGSFQFEILKSSQRLDSRSFSARVGRLALSEDGRPKNVPCVSEAEEGMLPLTSVLAVERVILGGRADLVRRKNGSFIFSYDVQINNARESDVEVVGHFWEVVDSKGHRHIAASGEGVGGVFTGTSRSLAAGDAFRVQGQVASPTAEGNAQGTYRVRIQEAGNEIEIEARTDWMGLSADKETTHVPNFVADPNFL